VDHMQVISALINSFLVLVVLLSLYTDYRSGKIYNKITLPALCAGVVLNILHHGSSGLLLSATGVGVALSQR